MNAMISAGFHFPQALNLIKLVVTITVCKAVKAGWNFSLVIVDTDIERIVRPDHSINSSNISRHWLHIVNTQRLPRFWRCDPIQSTKLITHQETPFIVCTKIDPRTLLLCRNRIQQLNLKTFCRLDARDWRCSILWTKLPFSSDSF